MDTTMESMKKEAEERVIIRREELKKLCFVRDIKASDKIERCFQKAHQVYKQCQIYVIERDYDHAYIFLWLLVELYQKKMPRHRDFYHPKYENERKRLDGKCRDALALLQRILDGMYEEELKHIKHIHEDEMHILEQHSTLDHVPSKPSTQDCVAVSLESRLSALKGLTKPATVDHSSIDVVSKTKALDTLRPSGKLASAATIYSSLPTPTKMESATSYPSLRNTQPAWLNSDIHERRSSFQNRTQQIKEEVRWLSIPSSLIAEFTRIAEPNTNMAPYGIETCGILAGTLKEQKLTITTLIIPKQQGSADTCNMTHEEELFEYCISQDLLTLGWIHTHPSQTCFLSSVDIHTQCGFQSMLSEAIAIVVAPKDPVKNIGVFRLTAPHGLELIQNCNLTGFHEHPSNIEIYSDALRLSWDSTCVCVVEDMRR